MQKQTLLYLAWGAALIATAGSLYFSEIRGFPPCVLCWYQRISMYPLVAILAVGILRRDSGVATYVLPLSLTGFVISVYQNLLYYNIVPESVAPCVTGISGTTVFIEWLGFITIPLLSLSGFALISTLMIIHLKRRE